MERKGRECGDDSVILLAGENRCHDRPLPMQENIKWVSAPSVWDLRIPLPHCSPLQSILCKLASFRHDAVSP